MLVERNVATGVANVCYGLSYGHDITVRNNRCVVSGNADWDAGPGTDIRLIAQSDWAVGLAGPWNSTGTPGFTNNSMRDNVSSLWNRTKGVRNDWWMPNCTGVCTGNPRFTRARSRSTTRSTSTTCGCSGLPPRASASAGRSHLSDPPSGFENDRWRSGRQGSSQVKGGSSSRSVGE